MYQVTMTGSAANPLVAGAPPISYTVVLSINAQSGNIVGDITHTQFPSFEVFVNDHPVYSSIEIGIPANLYNFVNDKIAAHPGP